MVTREMFDEILTEAYRRMHKSTCAEATLQALLKLWAIDQRELAWATAGYAGAIQSGNSTCGLLAGTGCAMGFRCGQDATLVSEKGSSERKNAIRAVKRFYKAFIKEFGSTECKQLCKCDFSKAGDVARYVTTRAWKTTCDEYLKFVLEYCYERTQSGKM